MRHERDTLGRTFGLLTAAIGSAAGLGNIRGFPHKMGKSGTFTFLLIYLPAVFVVFLIMIGALAMARKTGKGAIGTHCTLSKRFKRIGWRPPFLRSSS